MNERGSDGRFLVQPPKSFKDYHYKPRNRKGPCLSLVPYRKRSFNQPRQVRQCLRELGMVLPADFSDRWRDDRAFLERFYESARALYLRLAIHVHPRTLEDSEESAKSLHALWAKIKKIFYNHLRWDFALGWVHPMAMPVDFNNERWGRWIPERDRRGTAKCVCCGKWFRVKRKRTDPLCSSTCRKRNWRKNHRLLIQVRCANPRCQVRFISRHGAKYHSPQCAESHRKRRMRQKNLEFYREQARNKYQENRKTILERRRRRGSWYSTLPEVKKVIHLKRAAESGFRKRQLAKRAGLLAV